MELVCPICNKMIDYMFTCPLCGKQMQNLGPIQDFLDDYSPYVSMDIAQLVDGVSGDQCVHLFYCKSCNYDKRIPIQCVNM